MAKRDDVGIGHVAEHSRELRVLDDANLKTKISFTIPGSGADIHGHALARVHAVFVEDEQRVTILHGELQIVVLQRVEIVIGHRTERENMAAPNHSGKTAALGVERHARQGIAADHVPRRWCCMGVHFHVTDLIQLASEWNFKV